MIKRFCFGRSAPPPLAPTAIRPVRVALCTPVDELAERHGFVVQWFADVHALAGYEAWEREGRDLATPVPTEEIVQRGADWLDRRWAQGGRKWKHVALARRAPGLSCAEFSRRWRGHAGCATTHTAAAVPIPEFARGLAYVQNHPLPRATGDWPFDAITEVWFDDPQSMQSRVAWFRDNIATGDLFGEATFLAVMEEVLVEN